MTAPVESEPEQEEGGAGTVRSLDEDMFRSYGISGSTLRGISAIGDRAISIGTMHFGTGTGTGTGPGTGPGAPPFVNQPLDGVGVMEQVRTYAPTDTPERLADRLGQRPVAYLSGRAGSGRWTATLVALSRLHTSDRITLLHLSGSEELRTYFHDPELLRPGYGHIVEVPHGKEPTSSELTQLVTLARAAHAAVVFIGSADAANGQLVGYLVEHVRPEPREVFLVWLERWLRDRGSCLGGCRTCQGECVGRYVARCRAECVQYLAASTMADAVRFAADFAAHTPVGEEARDRLADGAALRARAVSLMQTAAPEGAGREQHHGRRLAQHRRAARLAFAVFHGYPLTTVFRATTSLVERLDAATGRPTGGRTVLEHNLEDLLDDIRLEAAADGEGSAGAARIARLRQPGLVHGLLDVAWHEYDTAPEPLLEWLDDLATLDDVRPVAAAAGLLCEYDFEQVRSRVLEPWAGSNKRARREAAAIACEFAVHHPDLASRVQATLAGWAAVPGYRRDTAARTHATKTFVRQFPLEGLSVLDQAAHDDMQRTSNAVPVGVRGLYGTHDDEVVQRLVRWADATSANPRVMASRCLVAIAEVRKDGWPQLLRQTAEGRVSLDAHARLWPAALLHPAAARRAWAVLESWIELAGSDPTLAEVLRDVLDQLFRSGPINRRAAFHHRWFWSRALAGNPFLATVTDLLEAHRHDH